MKIQLISGCVLLSLGVNGVWSSGPTTTSCDFDALFDATDDMTSPDEISAFMDNYMATCEGVDPFGVGEVVPSSSIPMASGRANNEGCLPNNNKLPSFEFRGKLTLKGHLNANLFVRGRLGYNRKGTDQCKTELTILSLDVTRIIISSKFQKKCVEITDTNVNRGCITCSYEATRLVEEPYSSTTTARPILHPCPGKIDIIQLLEISAATTNDNLELSLKPAAIRFLEAFNLSMTETSSGLLRFNNSSNEVIELGTDVGQNFVASKAIINLLTNSAGQPKIEKGLLNAYDRFVASGRTGVPKILLVFVKSGAFDAPAYEDALDKLFQLEDYLPFVVAFDLNGQGAVQNELKKIAGCTNQELCLNYVSVSTNDFEGVISAAEYMAKVACKLINGHKSAHPSIYPSIKMKVEDLKVADIEKITGVTDFLTHIKTQSAAGLGVSENSLVPYKITPALHLLDSSSATGFLTSKWDEIKGGSRNEENLAGMRAGESTTVEFLVVDEFEKVQKQLNREGGKFAFPEKLDEFLKKHLKIEALMQRSGPQVVQAVRDAKLKVRGGDGYAKTLIDMGKRAVMDENAEDAGRRLQLIELFKDRALLDALLKTKQESPASRELKAAYESASCLLDSGINGIADLGNVCKAFSRGTVIPNIGEHGVRSSLEHIKSVAANKAQLHYITRKAEPLGYLLKLKSGEIFPVGKGTHSFMPKIDLFKDLLH